MPYSIGSDKLEKVDPQQIKSELSDDEERKLSTDMRQLYARLLPTQEVEKNRTKLVQKLETIFNEAWPGHNIQVHLFGSSGNMLCSDDSDGLYSSPWALSTFEREPLLTWLSGHLHHYGLEGAGRSLHDCRAIGKTYGHLETPGDASTNTSCTGGMQKVVCVSSAKVPIVKIWDPELGLACDMNVNNTLALENTRMVRTYVQIDSRVRQLAMIIKYWTRRRIVNDAGEFITSSATH
jgi:DNA polymerase sigma